MNTIVPSTPKEDARSHRRTQVAPGHRSTARRARTVGAWLASLLVILLLLAACGGRSSPAGSEPATESEPTVAAEEEAAEEAAETSGDVSAGDEESTSSTFESPLQGESPLDVPPLSPLPTPPDVSEESSAFIGRVVSTQLDNQPMVDTVIRLGPITWDDSADDGTFVISGSEGYGAYTEEDGTFIVEDVEPGDYVILVGDMIGYNEVVTQSDGEARVYPAEAGELVDAGTLIVDLPEH